MSNWSYQVLCDDDAMETFHELSVSANLAQDIEAKLDKVTPYSDYRTSVEGLVAAALVAYAETDVSAYNLLDLDLDDPEDKAKFEREYKPFLNEVYHTDLSGLMDKAAKVLNKLPNTELGGWWYEEDQSIEWIENISAMQRELKIAKMSKKLEKRRERAGIYSYEALCSKDAQKTFQKLSKSEDLAGDIEALLNNVNKTADHRVCTAGFAAASLVAYAECEKINCYNLLNLDLDVPEDKEKFEKEYDPFLDQVYNTDLSRLRKKAAKVLRSLPDTKLGELWKAYDDAYDNWTENIDEMLEEFYKLDKKGKE